MNDLIGRSISAAASLMSEGKIDESELVCRQILIVDDNNPLAMRLLSCCLEKTDRKEESKKFFNAALKMAEGKPEIHNAMGISCMHARDIQKAIDHFQIAAELDPQGEDSRFNLAACMMMLGKPGEALTLFREANARSGSHKSMVGMACAKTEVLDLKGAEELLREVLRSDPEDTSARTNMACVLFLSGRWDEAWKYYTSRLKHYERLAKTVKNLNIPLWNEGDPPKGRLLVFSEQGIGDAINFGRMALCLAERYPDREVTVFVSPQLRPMMERQGLKTTSVTDGFDACCSMMDIPGLLGMSKEDISKTFVKIVSEKRCDMSMFAGVFKVGVCWAGNPAHPKDMNRSCSLGNFRDICRLDGVKLFSLQKDIRPRMWPHSPKPIDLSSGEGMRLVNMSPYMNSWEDAAAIISSLDLVISVDTSVMHLAAAMGKETWGLVPYVPDWRWGLNSEDTCWYPTLRLFRQKKPGDWDSVFSTVREQLAKKL
jgi:tetratricopeptide (TPR) repeat protein